MGLLPGSVRLLATPLDGAARGSYTPGKMRTTTRLTSKGQVVIPKSVRDRLLWRPGTRLEVETLPEGAVRLAKAGRKDRRKFDSLLDRVTGFLTEGDPIAALEAEHRAEIEADARRHRR